MTIPVSKNQIVSQILPLKWTEDLCNWDKVDEKNQLDSAELK